MEEIRQIYNTISDYVINPAFLKATAGILVVGGAICFGYSIKLLADIRKMGKEMKGLEQRLV